MCEKGLFEMNNEAMNFLVKIETNKRFECAFVNLIDAKSVSVQFQKKYCFERFYNRVTFGYSFRFNEA